MNNHINVLLVGMSNFFAKNIAGLLEKEGFNTFSAKSGRDAVNILKFHAVEVILADSRLTGTNVVNLINKIKNEENNSAEIIVLDNEPDITSAVEILKTGAFDYMAGPFKYTDILNKISEAITHYKLKKQTLIDTHITPIYKSSHIFSGTLDLNEVFSNLLLTIQSEFKISGIYVNIFNRDYTNKINMNNSFIKHLDSVFSYNKPKEIFNEKEVIQTIYKNSPVKTYLTIPMFNHGGLWGVCVYCREGEHKFSEIETKVLSIHTSQYSIALQNIFRFEDMTKGYIETVTSLSKAVDSKDRYTKGHSENVKNYSLVISNEMGMDKQFHNLMNYAGLLHDIGKIGVSSKIINKPSELDDREYHEMKKHPVYGYEILEPIGFLETASEFVLHHHEKMDGSGYPYGLKKDEIPLGAKILQVSDAFDAMVTDRSYRAGRTVREAVEELESCSNKQFDPEIVCAFKSALHRKAV